jgi:F-type H+-transporting ATPase subunit a
MRGVKLRWLVIAAIILAVAGFVFLRGPTPDIKVKPETLFSFGLVNVTNTMITSWIVVLIIVVLAWLGTRNWRLVPRGVQNFVEWLILEADVYGVPLFNYRLAENVAGEKNARRFFPIAATIFWFLLIANWIALVPIFNVIGVAKEEDHGFVMKQAGPVAYVALSGLDDLSWPSPAGSTIDADDPEAETKADIEREENGNLVGEILPLFRGIGTDLNVPLALAIISVFFVESWGLAAFGARAYSRKFFNWGGVIKGIIRLRPGDIAQGIMDGFVSFIELISEMVRLISFTFRLFGNLFAGEVVILMFVFLIPTFVPVTLYGLELFVGFIQAFIFAILTLVFAIIAVTPLHAEERESSHSPAGGG